MQKDGNSKKNKKAMLEIKKNTETNEKCLWWAYQETGHSKELLNLRTSQQKLLKWKSKEKRRLKKEPTQNRLGFQELWDIQKQ